MEQPRVSPTPMMGVIKYKNIERDLIDEIEKQKISNMDAESFVRQFHVI